MLIVALVVIAMSLILGAEQGPKADPTTTTYVPRPEWYFFFLFELLRVLKPPELTPIATIGIPTICMVALLLLPFYDRGPERRPERRPIATTAGILIIVAMAYLTYLGATGGSPSEIDMQVAKRYEPGKEVVAQSGCLACHKLGENGNNGPGPELTHIAEKIPRAAIIRSVQIGPGDHALLPGPLAEEDQSARRFSLLARLAARDSPARIRALARLGFDRAMTRRSRLPSLARLRSVRRAGKPDVRPDRRSLRRDELGDDRRAPSPLAPARRRSCRAAAGGRRPRRLLRHRGPRGRAGASGSPRTVMSSAATSPSRCSTSPGRRPPGRIGGPVRFEWADALELPYGPEQFDAVSGRLRGPQPGRPRPRPRRDGPGPEAGWASGDPRDHHAEPAAALDLLLALVRPGGAAPGHRRR